jgi:hypothetical protein
LRAKAANCREFKGFGVGMTSFRSNRGLTQIALAAAIGMAMVIGCAGTFAQAADDNEDELLDVKIFRNIMKGLGLRRDEAGIQYRERSPLVLPPGKDLPQPEVDNPAKKAAGWPDDPDIKRARQRKEAERKRKSFEPGVDDKPLTPAQLSTGAAPVGNRGGEAPGKSMEGSSAPSTNAELGSKGFSSMLGGLWAPKEEYVPFTGEPPRASLIDPPAGYRTPSPAQPYGVGREKWTPTATDKNEPVK